MNNKITSLVDRIARLEQELLDEIKEQQEQFHYKLKGKKVQFERSAEEANRKLKVAILPWLKNAKLRNAISSPFIYAMVIPLLFLDVTVTVYQHICFRLYGIRRVQRDRYVVLDRHQLAYLNGIEKLNCVYCGYGNGVVAYAREIIARTEQYWCPIKHARKVLGTHRHYNKFVAFGDGENYRTELIRLRGELKEQAMAKKKKDEH